MPVALSACHRSHLSARVVSITLKISNTVLNNINSSFTAKSSTNVRLYRSMKIYDALGKAATTVNLILRVGTNVFNILLKI